MATIHAKTDTFRGNPGYFLSILSDRLGNMPGTNVAAMAAGLTQVLIYSDLHDRFFRVKQVINLRFAV
jgi:hypothetical protein